MTNREYLQQLDDEFEKSVMIVNLARRCPNYDLLSDVGKKKVLKQILDEEMKED